VGRDSEDVISTKVAEIAERRGAIDQTEGMLMLVYSIDEGAAFNLLKSLSQIHNMKLALLAQQIAKADSAPARAHLRPPPERHHLISRAILGRCQPHRCQVHPVNRFGELTKCRYPLVAKFHSDHPLRALDAIGLRAAQV